MNKEKIQLVLKKMLDNEKEIEAVLKAGDEEGIGMEEYYFTFPNDKYLWSVLKNPDGENFIFYYPSKDDKSVFLRFGSGELDVTSKEYLKQLFSNLRGKLFGFDRVLDDILGLDDF